MARVLMKLYTTLQGRIIKDDKEYDASNIAELLGLLADNYGEEFRKEIYDGEEIKNYYIVLHNGKAVDRSNPEGILLNNGDTVHVFPPVSGG